MLAFIRLLMFSTLYLLALLCLVVGALVFVQDGGIGNLAEFTIILNLSTALCLLAIGLQIGDLSQPKGK